MDATGSESRKGRVLPLRPEDWSVHQGEMQIQARETGDILLSYHIAKRPDFAILPHVSRGLFPLVSSKNSQLRPRPEHRCQHANLL